MEAAADRRNMPRNLAQPNILTTQRPFWVTPVWMELFHLSASEENIDWIWGQTAAQNSTPVLFIFVRASSARSSAKSSS